MPNLKELIPLFHRLFKMMFDEMRKSGVDDEQIKWYADAIATLLSSAIIEIYEDKKEFEKYMNKAEADYNKFEDSVLKPEAEA